MNINQINNTGFDYRSADTRKASRADDSEFWRQLAEINDEIKRTGAEKHLTEGRKAAFQGDYKLAAECLDKAAELGYRMPDAPLPAGWRTLMSLAPYRDNSELPPRSTDGYMTNAQSEYLLGAYADRAWDDAARESFYADMVNMGLMQPLAALYYSVDHRDAAVRGLALTKSENLIEALEAFQQLHTETHTGKDDAELLQLIDLLLGRKNK
jgi:hypothetical protein